MRFSIIADRLRRDFCIVIAFELKKIVTNMQNLNRVKHSIRLNVIKNVFVTVLNVVTHNLYESSKVSF